MSPHWGGIRVAERTGGGQAKIPGRPRMEVCRLPQWGGILVAGEVSIEVAAGGKGRGRRWGQRTRSAQDDGSLPCRQRGQISGSLQEGGRR